MDSHRSLSVSEQKRRASQMPNMAQHSTSFDKRTRSDDSWVEISSQPSSSSLSSAADDIITTGLRVQHDPRIKRRRALRQNVPSNLTITQRVPYASGTSSQEEYEESESESDRVMTSSGEGPLLRTNSHRAGIDMVMQSAASDANAQQMTDDDDERRTAVNYPTHADQCFTPQPNAFSHPPSSSQSRPVSQPVTESYFPPQRTAQRPATRHSYTGQDTSRQGHMPQNILSPSYNAAAQNEEALRASLSTLLSCAAAARGLQRTDSKRTFATTGAPPRSNKIEPISLHLVPESALPVSSPPQSPEPTFKPTIRRESTSTSTSSAQQQKENKRKAAVIPRASSRERRALKKARRSSPSEDLHVSPTLLTWVVSAGVVVFLSALSFSAGYSMGREAGRIEAGSFATEDHIRSCAREAGRSSLGLKRSLARSAVQV